MRYLTYIALLMMICSCSNTRWTIVDTQAVNPRDQTEILNSTFEIMEMQLPALDNPTISFAVQQVNDTEVPRRILVERTVQRYRPKPFFTLFGGLGAGVAFYAANSDGLFNNLTSAQSIAFNATGLLLAAVTVANMEPVGVPIRTGEQKYLRRSGEYTRKDTSEVETQMDFSVNLMVEYAGTVVYTSESELTGSERLNLNLGNLLQNRDVSGLSPGTLDISVEFQDQIKHYSYPVNSFMVPVVRIESPVAQIRNEPVINSNSLFSEVGTGSELPYLGQIDNQWFEVQYGGSSVYIAMDDGEIRWNQSQNGTSPTVYTISEVPFGDLAVENSIPVIRESDPFDAGFILSAHEENQLGQRNYIERDLQLMNLYFNNALDLPMERLFSINVSDSVSFKQELSRTGVDSVSTLFVYIEGFGRLVVDSTGTASVDLVHVNVNGEESTIALKTILDSLGGLNGRRLVIFSDIEFNHDLNTVTDDIRREYGSDVLLRTANSFLANAPNSVLIFSSRTDQQSGVYASERFENMHHHIFPYYIALGLQRRLTTMNELTRYLENQVDYTSRLLFDRPQEIQSFGNLTIDLSR